MEKISSLKEFAELLPVPCYWLDIDQQYLGINLSGIQVTGAESFEKNFLGKSPLDIYPKDLANQIMNHHEQVVRRGSKLSFEEVIQDLSTKQYKIFNVTITPIYDDQGFIIGTCGVSIEVTQEKKLTEKIKQEAYLLQQCANILPEPFYWLDLEQRYLGVNKRFFDASGTRSFEEDLHGKTPMDIYPKEMAEKIIANHKKVINTGKVLFSEEAVLDVSNQKHKIFNATIAPLYDHQDCIIGTCGISIDITELKQTQEKLKIAKEKAEAANKAKSKFIADISHDLRTPMTGVQGMFYCIGAEIESAFEETQAYRKTSADNELLFLFQRTILRIEDHVKDGDLSSKRITSLFDAILERIILDRIELVPVNFNLYKLLHEQLDLFLAKSSSEGIKLTLNIADNVPEYLTGVDFYLERSITNLIGNAMKFTQKGSVDVLVKIKGTEQQTYKTGDVVTLIVEVKDTGVGIPKDKLAEIFETFARLTPSYSREKKDDGYGLGLSNVKEYVAALQGKIYVDSEVEKGSCFTIAAPFTVPDQSIKLDKEDENTEKLARFRSHLPSVRKEELPHKKIEIAAPSLASTSSASDHVVEQDKHVLIAEDDRTIAIVTKTMLTSLGCSTDHAKNGSEAVKLASQNNYDLILMDIGLSKLVNGVQVDFDGDEAARRIRALPDPKRANVPIVAVTGHGGNPDKRQAIFDAGIQKILNKPATISHLKEVLKEYVSDRSSGEADSDSNQAPIIDWEGCVKKCLDDTGFARRMLSELSKDLHKTQDELSTHYHNWDPEALRAVLHRIRGSLCYFELPELECALRAFHETVKHKPDEAELLETQFNAITQAITHFWEAWDKLSSKLDGKAND